jgi:hypothetical protein
MASDQTPHQTRTGQKRPFPDPATDQAAGKLAHPLTVYPGQAATSDRPATDQPDPSGNGSGGGQLNVCTVDGLPAPAGINDGFTVPTVMASCLDVNSQTPTDGRQPGPKPNGPGSGASEFRFPIGKTKQPKPKQPKPDRKTPRECPQCGQMFTPRKTGRPPKYCSAYCRVAAFKDRQAARDS